MRRVALLLLFSLLSDLSGALFAPGVQNVRKLFEQDSEAPPPYNTPPTAPLLEQNPGPTSPDHFVQVTLPDISYNPDTTKQACDRVFELSPDSKEMCKALKASLKLGKRYESADAVERKNMDGTLRELVPQGLQSENAADLLRQSFPFLEHYIETQNDKSSLRKALKDAQKREIHNIRNIYEGIITPSDGRLHDGETKLLKGNKDIPTQFGPKTIKGFKKDQRRELRAESRRNFVAERPHFNHAYVLQKDKSALLAALYQHLPWRQKFALWRDLRRMRKDIERARERYYGGLIHMFK